MIVVKAWKHHPILFIGFVSMILAAILSAVTPVSNTVWWIVVVIFVVFLFSYCFIWYRREWRYEQNQQQAERDSSQ